MIAAATTTTEIDLDHVEFLAELQGCLHVNDTNSPGGKRPTRIYALKAVYMRGASVAF